jgi:hypothetical protein
MGERVDTLVGVSTQVALFNRKECKGCAKKTKASTCDDNEKNKKL